MTNTGTEKPTTDNPITKRSIQVPCFHAAITPSGTATRIETMMVESAIEIEGSTRWLIIFSTGRFGISETPKSPCSSLFIQVKNCSYSGSFRPSEARIRSNCSGVALSPARMAAGSPGVSRSSRNTNSATTPITGMAASTRRTRYPSIGLAYSDPAFSTLQKSFMMPFSHSGVRLQSLGYPVPSAWSDAPSLQRRQQPRHQPAALGQAVDLDMFVERMRVGAADAQPIERRDSHCAGEIGIGTAPDAAVGQFEPHLLRHPSRLFIERHGAAIGLPHRTGHAAADLE